MRFINLNVIIYVSFDLSPVEEIIGNKTSYVFGRHLFNKLKTKADIDLENLVYFKDETHYFVMTARKSSLLKRGVLKEVWPDLLELHKLK